MSLMRTFAIFGLVSYSSVTLSFHSDRNNPFLFFINKTHGEITQDALREISVSFSDKGKAYFLSFSRSALNEIAVKNAEQDIDQHARYHFDNELILESSSVIRDHLTQIKIQLNNQNGAEARAILGAALHTIQDYFSHTNWIDLHHKSDPIPAGPNFGALLVNGLGTTEAACKNASVLIDTAPKITSGYFDPTNLVCDEPPGSIKCRHGGFIDSNCDGIAKDSSEHKLHTKAKIAAVVASRAFVQQLINDYDPAKKNEHRLALCSLFYTSTDEFDCSDVIFASIKPPAMVNAGAPVTFKIRLSEPNTGGTVTLTTATSDPNFGNYSIGSQGSAHFADGEIEKTVQITTGKIPCVPNQSPKIVSFEATIASDDYAIGLGSATARVRLACKRYHVLVETNYVEGAQLSTGGNLLMFMGQPSGYANSNQACVPNGHWIDLPGNRRQYQANGADCVIRRVSILDSYEVGSCPECVRTNTSTPVVFHLTDDIAEQTYTFTWPKTRQWRVFER